MKQIDISQIKTKNELGSLKKSVSGDSYEEIAKKIIKADNELTKKLNTASAYRAEYDELMSRKRIRTLTKEESRRAKILKSNIDYYDDLRDTEFKNLEVRLKSGEISENEYYQNLSVMRDLYFEKGSEGWAKYTIMVAEYNKKVIDKQKEDIGDLLKDLGDEYSQSLDEIIKKQEKMYSKLNGISDVYSRISVNGGKDGETYSWLQLSNIDAEIEAIKNYNDSIMKAKKRTDDIFDGLGLENAKTRNVKEMFFSQLANLSIPEATGFSNYLNNIPEERLRSYLSKWVTKLDLSDSISKNLYSDEAHEVIEGYATELSGAFSQNIQDKLTSIPDNFFESGTESANQFKNGFIAAIDEVISDISDEMNKKIKAILPDVAASGGSNTVNNNSSYNIYEAVDPKTTALEIYKQEALKRMLVGE